MPNLTTAEREIIEALWKLIHSGDTMPLPPGDDSRAQTTLQLLDAWRAERNEKDPSSKNARNN